MEGSILLNQSRLLLHQLSMSLPNQRRRGNFLTKMEILLLAAIATRRILPEVLCACRG